MIYMFCENNYGFYVFWDLLLWLISVIATGYLGYKIGLNKKD